LTNQFNLFINFCDIRISTVNASLVNCVFEPALHAVQVHNILATSAIDHIGIGPREEINKANRANILLSQFFVIRDKQSEIFDFVISVVNLYSVKGSSEGSEVFHYVEFRGLLIKVQDLLDDIENVLAIKLVFASSDPPVHATAGHVTFRFDADVHLFVFNHINQRECHLVWKVFKVYQGEFLFVSIHVVQPLLLNLRVGFSYFFLLARFHDYLSWHLQSNNREFKLKKSVLKFFTRDLNKRVYRRPLWDRNDAKDWRYPVGSPGFSRFASS